LSYDKLLIATGGRPMLVPTLKPFKKNIQTYYSLDDIFLLKKKLAGKNSCLVYGQGLSALDLMRGLRNLGKKVFYMTKGEKVNFPLITSQFDQDINDFLADKGVELILNDFIVGIAKTNNSFQVQTLNKKEINVDIVFAWETYEPNLEVIAGTAIEKKTGILVDLQLRTTEKDIYAAGDCVEIYHPELKDYWINFGWPNAEKQGELAGKNMTGQSQEYQIQQTIPFNLFGKSLKARWWA
jgi:NAD(P)H-nitrite reductase large subunit